MQVRLIGIPPERNETSHALFGAERRRKPVSSREFIYLVRVGEPDPRFGKMLLEQFGGANGELAAAMRYSVQGIYPEDPETWGLDWYRYGR